MWPVCILAFSVGLSCAAENGWNAGSEYKYLLGGRTMTGLHQAADQYSGLAFTSQLTVQAQSPDLLTLQVTEGKYADIQQNISGGWEGSLSGSAEYSPFLEEGRPFQLHLKNGIVQKMVVEEDLDQWELNLYKAIASLFQVDTQGENLVKSKKNQLPQNGAPFGTYKTMEESVNGEYETLYDISPLPEYVAAGRPELAPLPHLRGPEGQLIDIGKTRNFSRPGEHLVHRFGAQGSEGYTAGSSHMGDFLQRVSVSRIILSGDLDKYTIQSSVTTEKVIVAPHLYNGQKGITASRLNITLEAVNPSGSQAQSISRPKEVTSLVYDPKKLNENGWRRGSSEEGSSSSSSESSSSENSSSESKENQSIKYKKSKDSKKENQRKEQSGSGENNQDSSSSSSSDSSSSSGSSSMSSSEEVLPQSPLVSEAPLITLLPDYLGGWDKGSVNYAEQMVSVAKEIGRWVHKPDRVHQQHILERFVLLTQLAAEADSEQQQQASQALYYQGVPEFGNEEESKKYQSWVAFRDAIAQAGTGPALVTIQEWIKSKKVGGGEAAMLVSALPNSARYPSADYINYFFDMIKQPMIQKQRHLNSSAILSFSELVRKSEVDNGSSRGRYGIHLGDKEQKKDVVETYIPYLQSQLGQAVAAGDSPRIQVYVRALGNVAHPRILSVLEPYLEGEKQVSEHQRLAMVTALDELTRTHPSLARAVLYRLYQNTADRPAIRVAAVILLMRTSPPAQMLQRMAEFTHHDHSKEVSAAVKSAIESAAYNTDEGFAITRQLQENARAAVSHLSPRDLGVQYSRTFIRSFFENQHATGYKQEASYIQGQDSHVPWAAMYQLHRRVGGYDLPNLGFSFLSSSSQNLYDYLYKQQKGNKPQRGSATTGYSYEKVADMVHAQTEEQAQVEGQLLLALFGSKHFIAFDNHTISQDQEYMKVLQNQLQKGGIDFQATKFNIEQTMEVAFPLAMGFPFFLSVQQPSMFSARGQVKGGFQRDNSRQPFYLKGGLSGQIEATYAGQMSGKMGFSAMKMNRKYVSGVNKKTQVYVPLQGHVELLPQMGGLKADLKPSGGETRLFTRNSEVYTTHHDNKQVKPYQEGEHYAPISVRPTKHYQKNIGNEKGGYILKMEASTESEYFNFAKYYKEIKDQDYISALLNLDQHEELANSNMTILYDPQSITANGGIQFSAGYQSGQQTRSAWIRAQRAAAAGNMAQPSAHERRREELYARAGEGITDARVGMFDAALKVGAHGPYSLTLAHAASPVSEKARLLAYAQYPVQDNPQPRQAAFQVNIKKPKLSTSNYQDAINADPTTSINGQINFQGSSSPQIQFNGQLSRSEERKAYVESQGMSQECQRKAQGNKQWQNACWNASVQAGILDHWKLEVQTSDVPRDVSQSAYQLYGLARWALSPYHSEDLEEAEDGRMALEASFQPDLSSASVHIQGAGMDTSFQNVSLSGAIRTLLAYHPTYDPLERISQQMTQNYPYAAAIIDRDSATTFDNKSYPINLGDCYHVVAMYVAPQGGQASNNARPFAVLVKEDSNKQKEVKMILGEDNIDIKPSGSSGLNVQANGQSMELSQNKISKWSSEKEGSNYTVEAYMEPKNTAVINAPDFGITLRHDGSRLQLKIGGWYMGKVRGLAGSFDGEEADDFSAPNNRVLRNPQQFAATYALTEDSACKGPARGRQQAAGKADSYDKATLPGQSVNDEEAGRESGNQESCTQYRVKVISNGDKTCFSRRPQMSCGGHCRPAATMQKTIDFHCLDSNSATRHWVQMVRMGGNPDFSQKGSNYRQEVALPESCAPRK